MLVENTMYEFQPEKLTEVNTEVNTIVVSVIVPVYNAENYLERCLESIINQTYKNIEIICVDDGSTDNSGEILDRFAKSDSRIVVIHQDNRGISSARNAALTCVKGRYVLFVDSDDWIERDAIEEFISHMTDEVDIVVAGAKIEDEGGDDADRLEELKKIYKSKLSGKFRLDDNFISGVTVVVWSKLFKYDIIKEKGLTFLDGRQYEDNHFTVEYLVHSKNGFFVNKDLYHYVRKPNTVMNREFNYRDCLYVFDHLYKRLDRFGLLPKYKNTISKRYSSHLRQAYEKTRAEYRNDVMELATFLSQDYNPVFFNSDLVSHVRNREYGLEPQFDKHVLILVKTTSEHLNDAFKTIKSLFSQSYRTPKVILYIDSVEKEKVRLNLPEELRKRVDKELLIKSGSYLSLEDTLKEAQDFVVVTVESGVVYSAKWLRCVMAAYSDYKDAFASFGFDSINTRIDAILFKDFAVIDIGLPGKVTVLKPKQTIVSITSYPARINSVSLALETVFKQTRKPDNVILWLAKSQFPNQDKDLPKELLRFVSKKGLEIRWCEDDLKPHKKYFYAFQEYPDALIITIDDDILYPPDRIENLFLSYLLHPYAVSAARAHLIPVSETGKILPYKLWPQEIDAYVDKPSLQLCSTGCGGVLYPTALFSKVRACLLDKEIIMRSCLNADDLWLKGMELVAGIPVVVAEESRELCYTPDSQEVGLWHGNVDGGNNDRQLLQIEEEIDRRYGGGTFRKKLLDTTVGENLVGAEALSGLIRFYKNKVKKQVNQIKKQYAKYSILRMDIQNRGDEGCDVIEQLVTPDPVSLCKPQWLPGGITVESSAGRMSVDVQCKGDGELEIGLMGLDVRNEDGKRYPVWIDCTYFAVNREVVFADTKTVCHDKRYVYRKPVADGEFVQLEVAWSECRSSNVLDEYRQLQTELRNSNNKANQLQAGKDELAKERDANRKEIAALQAGKDELAKERVANRKEIAALQEMVAKTEQLEAEVLKRLNDDEAVFAKERQTSQEKIREIQKEAFTFKRERDKSENRLEETLKALSDLREINCKQTKELQQKQQQLARFKELQQMVNRLEQEKDEREKELKRVSRHLNDVKTGLSFNLGRVITFIPRKIRDLLKK